MASVKVKFRPSSVNGKEGSIYYQVIHNRAVRQITADLYVHESEWNAGTSSVTAPSQADADRKHHLHIIQKYISRDVLRLENIIRDLTLKGVCSADAIVDGYRKQTSLQSFFNFMDSVIGQLKRLNRERTSETYASALSSFMRFRRNKDIQNKWYIPEYRIFLYAYPARHLQPCCGKGADRTETSLQACLYGNGQDRETRHIPEGHPAHQGT